MNFGQKVVDCSSGSALGEERRVDWEPSREREDVFSYGHLVTYYNALTLEALLFHVPIVAGLAY